MKWRKIGQIFKFDESPFKNRFISHAQSPQAIVFDDFVRVYFSTRKKDISGKFLSYVQYVDYNKKISKIINFSNDEVIKLGKIGCFDEHGIFPFSPLQYKGKIFAYTNGWTRRVSVDIDSSIGFAISDDNGETFNKLGDGPILTSSLFEPFLIGDPFVKVYNKKYYMFYIFGEKWIVDSKVKNPERVYKIGYAISNDGLNWEKRNKKIINDILGADECQALPTIIKIRNQYHMFFCYRQAIGFRETKDKGYRIGHAYSDNLKDWIRNDSSCSIKLSKDGWDSKMQCYPNVFECNDKIYLLYNGNKFGENGFGLAILDY